MSSTKEEQLRIERELLHRAFSYSKPVFVATVLNASLFFALFYSINDPVEMWTWFVVSMVVAIYRVSLVYRFEKVSKDDLSAVRMWSRRFSDGVKLGSSCWAMAALLFYPQDSYFHLAIYMLSMTGVASGGSFALASNIRNVTWYVLLISAAVGSQYVINSVHVGWYNVGMVVLMIGVYNFFLIVSANRYMKSMIDQIRLQIENDKLVHRLTEEKEKAESANHAKGQFLATMSHEIRTPMNGVIGMIQLMKGERLSPTHVDYVQTMDRSANALLKILNEILDYSKVEVGRLELEVIDFNWRELIHDVGKLMGSNAAAKGLEFSVSFSSAEPEIIFGDPTRLRQILSNLLSNSIKFTDKGKISVHVSIETMGSTQVKLNIEIHDTGIGINEEAMERIFHQFSQADSSMSRKFGGTGLGLAISQKLSHLMGTEITVSSEEGEGSTFRLCPVFYTRDGHQKSVYEEVDSSEESSDVVFGKVLLVDDDALCRKVGKLLVEKTGMTCETACNGIEAIEKAKSETWDIILMDYQMPDMDGLETTSKIRGIKSPGFKQPHIVACTANAYQKDEKTCLDAGMNDFLSKPIYLDELKTVLRKWVELKSAS